jgi:hypothetical protein
MIAHPPAIVVPSLDPNFTLIEAVADAQNGLVDLWETSPVRLDSNAPKTDEIIDILFPGNPLLCCGWDRHRFSTRARNHWHKLHDLQFIVPNPMTARLGRTKNRKISPHSLSNTGPRRFLIVEFDFDAGRSAEKHDCFLNSREKGVMNWICPLPCCYISQRSPRLSWLFIAEANLCTAGFTVMAEQNRCSEDLCSTRFRWAQTKRVGLLHNSPECQMDCEMARSGKRHISSIPR